MSNQGQVNVNTGPGGPDRNQDLPQILGGVAVALLVIGFIFFLVGPGATGPGPVTPTAAEGEATPGPGQAPLPPGTGQAGPTDAPAPASTPESTPAELPTAAVSPAAGNAGPLDQQVTAALQAVPVGTAVTGVRPNGPDILEIDFTIPQSASLQEAGAAAKGQVRAILSALRSLPGDLGRVTLSGFYDLPGQPDSVPVKLDYLSDVIKSTDWAALPEDQLYALADVQAVKEEFR